MRPAVAASEDMRREFVWKSRFFEIFQKLPEFSALVFSQIFHSLRRSGYRGMSALDKLYQSSQRIDCRARSKGRTDGFNVFAQVSRYVAHKTVRRFDRTNI